MANVTLPDRKYPSEIQKALHPKKIESVVTNKAVMSKKTVGNSFKSLFITENGESVFSFVFHDIVVPAIKNTIQDVITNGISIILFGDRTNGVTRYGDRSYINNSYRPYNTMYQPLQSSLHRPVNPYTHVHNEPVRIGRSDFRTITYQTRQEAENVLNALSDTISDYGEVTVADFYQLSGIESKYTDNNFGWLSIRDAYINQNRNGYSIQLPQPRPLV